MRSLITLFMLLAVTCAWCQGGLKSRDLNTKDGLPSNYVINMVQDPRGYIWMATSDGLCRYDGYSFDVLRHSDTGNDSLLLSNRLRELHQNPNGLLFIRLQGEHYSCYDTGRRRFVQFIPDGNNGKNYCNCTFTPDGATWLWYEYTGCIEVTYKDGKVTGREYNVGNGQLPSNNVRFIEADSRGRVWIGTDKSLHVKEGESLRCVSRQHGFTHAAVSGDTIFFSTTDNQVMHADKEGRLHTDVEAIPGWLPGNSIRGLVPTMGSLVIITQGTTYRIDTHSGAVGTNREQIPGGSVYRDNTGNYYVADNAVNIYYFDNRRGEVYSFHILDSQLLNKRGIRPYGLVVDHEGTIWVSTIGNGLFSYVPSTRQLTHFTPRNGTSSPIKSDYLYGEMVDRSGNIWVSQENMGLSVITTMPGGVRRHYATGSSTPDYANLFRVVRMTSDGKVWGGNFMGGTYQLAGDMLLKTSIGVDDDMLAICRDSKGRQWVGTRRSGLSIDGRFHTHQPDDPHSLAGGKVFDILEDRDHRMWVAVNMGALCLATQQADGSWQFRKFLDDTPLMRNVTRLVQTRSGLIFAGCGDGVVVFHPAQLAANPKAYHYYNSSNSTLGYFEIRDILEDHAGVVWLASAGGGLYKVGNPSDAAHLTFEQLTTHQGLADNTANSLVEDAGGRLWIGTHYGLSRLDTRSMQFTTHYLSTDLLGDVYSEHSACRLGDGTLVFGTNNGIVSFNPGNTQDEDGRKAHPTITNLLVNGAMYNEYDEAETISLKHRQNSLTFRFSDLKFDFPHDTEYEYMLEGADRHWSLPTRQNEAVYKDLAPGNYVFHVRIANSEREATMEVNILHPWWNTWLAWLFYLLIAGGLAWYVIRLLLITYSMRNRIRMDKEISEFKQRFFMDVSHEFRTPLTLIQGAMERIGKTGELPSSLKQPISNMQRSTDRMMRLVNQLLEFHKYEHGKLSLRLQQTDVVRFLRDITMSFSDVAQNRQTSLQFVPFAQHHDMFIDRGFLDKILHNLLSNALKYTPRKGDVVVRVKHEGERLIIRVEDNGVGVPKEKQAQLFTRFMQTNTIADSMGIGLHFTQQLVKAHHGDIRYEERPGGGSIFVVEIPETPGCYQPGDYLDASDLVDEAATSVDNLRHYRELMSAPLNDRVVLVVEDDDDVREYIKCELAPYFTVKTAPNGEEALEMVRAHAIDLVVSDIRMPVMDGITLLKKLRADDSIFDIPFILLTAIDSVERQLEGVRFGADAYIPKPFSPALLVGKSISLIEQRERLKAAYSAHAPAAEGSTPAADTSAEAPLIRSERDRKFREIVDKKIESNMDNPDLMVDDLAQATGYGRSQFYGKMMEVTGTTPKDYIRTKRMARAAELLRSGEMTTVAEVAYKVGFSDALYFSRCFKQHFGVTPSKYQKG